MTSRSRRKRRTTPRLASIWASAALGLLGMGAVRAEAPPQPLPAAAADEAARRPLEGAARRPLEGVARRPLKDAPKRTLTEAEKAFRSVRARTNAIQQVQLSDDVRLKRGTGVADPDDDQYFYKIVKEPPTGARLFAIGSERSVLRAIESEYKRSQPGQAFLLPNAQDDFNVADMPTLGPSWFQNRRTGRGKDISERRGDMRIAGGMAEYPIGSGEEVAVLNESVGSKNVAVSVQVQLGRPRNLFGLVFRAQDPSTILDQGLIEEAVDQIKGNKFYYAVLSADTVEVGVSDAGARKTLKEARIEPRETFRLEVVVFGKEIRVQRDGEEILRLEDGTIPEGTFTGVIGLRALGSPIRFDNFLAVRYGGPYIARAFPPSLSRFPGPNVHYWPLYFEQVALERYGHHVGNLFQPFFSHMGFFFDTAGIFYSMGKSCPWECQSNEGYFKPGDVILPQKVEFPVFDPKGFAFETAFLALSFSLIP